MIDIKVDEEGFKLLLDSLESKKHENNTLLEMNNDYIKKHPKDEEVLGKLNSSLIEENKNIDKLRESIFSQQSKRESF